MLKRQGESIPRQCVVWQNCIKTNILEVIGENESPSHTKHFIVINIQFVKNAT